MNRLVKAISAVADWVLDRMVLVCGAFCIVSALQCWRLGAALPITLFFAVSGVALSSLIAVQMIHKSRVKWRRPRS